MPTSRNADLVHLNSLVESEPTLGVAGPNAVLCETCSVLCVLEHSRVDKSSTGPLKHEFNWLKAGNLSRLWQYRVCSYLLPKTAKTFDYVTFGKSVPDEGNFRNTLLTE
jgi:hypothetical protein